MPSVPRKSTNNEAYVGSAIGLLGITVVKLFEEVGFECIAVRRMIYPDRRYVEGEATMEGVPGVDRSRLQGRFQNISELDIRSAAVHYLYRKPS